MKQYHELLQTIIDKGLDKEDRTGTGTRSLFGYQMRIDLNDGFPLLTTKKMFTKAIIHELLWFLMGDTNIKYLVDNGVRIWNEWPYETYKASSEYQNETLEEFVEKIKSDNSFAKKWGDLGPVYGKQWIKWESPDGSTINQIQNAVDMIKNKRREIFLSTTISNFMQEADKLGITKAELKRIIEEYKEI